MFLLVKFAPRGSGSWWSLLGGLVVSQCLHFPSKAHIFSSMWKFPKCPQNRRSRSQEQQNEGTRWSTHTCEMSFCLVYCEWHFPQLVFSPRFKLLPSMKVSRDLVHSPYFYRLKPNEPVPVPSCRDCSPYFRLPSQQCVLITEEEMKKDSRSKETTVC